VRSPDQSGLINNNNAARKEKPMIYQIRADRDVTSKAPEGTGTRRRTVRVPLGPPITFVFGATPTYVECDELPIEIITDDHLLTKAVEPQNLDIEIVVINLKSERVQEELTASTPIQELKSERVQKPNRKRD
jgi:hypothetical protein